MNDFQVKLIGDKNAPLGESLGITPERWSELIPVLHAAFKTSSTITECVSKVSEYTVHANELAMVCLTIGMLQEREINPFEKLLSILTR